MDKRLQIKACCLLLMIISNACTAATDDAYEVWVYSLFPSYLTHKKINPFIEYLTQETNTQYWVNVSLDVPELVGRCKSGKPSMVISSLPVGQEVHNQCNYEFVAISFQDIHLYAKKDSAVKSLSSARKIGVVSNTETARVATEEISNRGLDIEIAWFSSFYEIIREYRQEGLDGIVLSTNAYIRTNNTRRNWEPIHQFSKKGIANVMVSPNLDDDLKARIIKLLLNNDENVSNVFQGNFGIGPFLPPETRLTQ